jgi:hypothetical protein
MVVTTRLSGGKGGRNALEAELRRLSVTQNNARPNHPTTRGKVERFQPTLKQWRRAVATRPTQPARHHRAAASPARPVHQRRQPPPAAPVRSLPHRATPATVSASLPKAQPTSSRHADTHDRVRRDRIDKPGCVSLRVAGRLT